MAAGKFQSVTIEGFKSIRALTVELRPINILIGANGSGKSNFLEAFRFMEEAHSYPPDAYLAKAGGANRILHYGAKVTDTIIVQIDSLSRNWRIKYHLMQEDRLAGSRSDTGIVGANLPSFRVYRMHDTSAASPLKRTAAIDDNRLLRSEGENLASFLYLLKQSYPDALLRIEDCIRQIAPFFGSFLLEPLKLNPNTIKLEWNHSAFDSYCDASMLSDGTLRFIALATLLLQPVELRPDIILIDEPELGLHPRAIGLLASLIKQASVDTQVVVATQSPLLVDYFEPEDILVADRINGATEIRRLQAEPLRDWLKEYSLGELWEKGELEGTPRKE